MGGQKRKVETPMEGFGICSTVSLLSSRRFCKPVERCCSCTWHTTCSTVVLYARVCECCNAGQQCTECYCWVYCKNQGRLRSSPTTVRGLLGHFLRGADPPTTDQRASTLPVRSPTSSSLWALLAAGAGGRGAQGGASGRRSPRDGGGEVLEQRGGTGTENGGQASSRGLEMRTTETAAATSTTAR